MECFVFNTSTTNISFAMNSTNSTNCTVTLKGETSEMNTLTKFQLALMVTIGLIGSIGNALVLLVLSKAKHRTKTSSVLLLNLAVCGALVSTLCIPLDISELILGRFVYGSALCKVIYPFQTSLPIVSSYTLMFMLLERNMIFSSRIRSKLRSNTVRLLAVVTWVLPAAMVVPYVLKLHLQSKDGRPYCDEIWSNNSHRKVYTVSLSVVEYLIPIVFIIHFVVRIVSCLRRERNRVKKGLLGLGRRTSKRRIRTQRRLAIIFIVMVVSYASLKLPNNIFWQVVEFKGGLMPKLQVVRVFVGLCAYSTCATNPFILILMSSEFRKDIRNMFCMWKKPLKRNNNNFNSTESERTAMMTTITAQSSLTRTFSTKARRTSCRSNRQQPPSSDLSEAICEMRKKMSVVFKEPEQIPMTYLATDSVKDVVAGAGDLNCHEDAVSGEAIHVVIKAETNRVAGGIGQEMHDVIEMVS